MKFFNVLVLVALVSVVALFQTSEAQEKRAGYSYGCGKHGECWTWCDNGDGWCYTGESCSTTTDCNANAACKAPRVCHHDW